MEKTTLNAYGFRYKEVLKRSNTITDIDTNITAPMFKYKSIHEYYEKSSCGNFLPTIDKCPTFILMNDDDPICGKVHLGSAERLTKDTCKDSAKDYVVFGIMERGGHLGNFESVFSTR